MIYPIDQSKRSPNHSPRGDTRISMIVLHATVGSMASALAWLINPASRVSSHYLIDKAGHISQLVADDQVAWHAGRALWHGTTAINECSLGIELENDNSGHDPYPPLQIASAHWLCQTKIAQYNIERADIVRHLDVAVPKGRKTDPAGLPWPLFADSLYLDSPPTPRDPHAGDTHYRVLRTATGGATIRSAPRTNAAVLGHLKAFDDWWGEAIPGQFVTVDGFASGSTWIRDSTMRCVFAGLLEEVK